MAIIDVCSIGLHRQRFISKPIIIQINTYVPDEKFVRRLIGRERDCWNVHGKYVSDVFEEMGCLLSILERKPAVDWPMIDVVNNHGANVSTTA